MGSNFFSIHFLFLACILLLVAPLSKCENANYTACSALYSCGKIRDIGYPFWGDDRPKICGIQDFKLNCVNNDTGFQIFKNFQRELSVHHINTSSQTMVYSLENLLNFCLLNIRRTQMLYSHSLVLSNVYNSTISIFYGCDPKCVSKTTHYKKSFTCATYGDGTKAIAYYFGHPSDAGDGIGKLCLCRNNVSLPAGERAYEELRSSNASLLSILTWQRIDVKYKFNLTACSKCEESGGRCGSSEDPSSYQFVCYCLDGFQPLVCPKLAAESQILAKKHVVSLSNADYAMYEACNIPYTCGKIQVGYPFWGDNRPLFCGVSQLLLSCKEAKDDQISFHGTDGFTVLSINTSAHTLSASPLRLLERCYSDDASNITTMLSHLRPDTDHSEEMRVFYACTNCDSTHHQSKSFACSYKNGTKSTAYYFHNEIGATSCSCKYNVSVPVDKRALVELQSSSNASLLSIVSKWPTKMEYIANFTACSKCSESGGRCGSLDHNEFVCYCLNGPEPLVCDVSALSRLAKKKNISCFRCSCYSSRDNNVDCSGHLG